MKKLKFLIDFRTKIDFKQVKIHINLVFWAQAIVSKYKNQQKFQNPSIFARVRDILAKLVKVTKSSKNLW